MDFLDNRRVLITGISGFTGTHLSHSLAAAGWEVLGLGQHRLHAGDAHLDADLLDTVKIADWLVNARPTHIVHLAALAHVVGDPLSFYRTNVLGTESLLEAIAAAGLKPRKVILASSANIYGNAQRSPIRESDPIKPVNHYALSKAAMEMVAMKWFGRMPIIIVRPFNYTGPGQSEAFVFPKIVAAFQRRDPVLRLGNLDVARDLSDIRFIVEAYVRLLISDAVSEAFNICSGRSVTLLSVLDLMADVAGYRPEIEIDPTFVRRDEIKDLCGDPSRLVERVGPIDPIPLRETLVSMYNAFGEQGPAISCASNLRN
ncbi:MAG: GDP-mannose 4,6-dehydratase [Aromatoleum sp.]|uniref:GDP-mannose 4,6-dehydratase n=1 Tax=Aromatoleum sp. TaxID=2307007 RepID=UPI002893E73A|nr:GDP-mannose 4,6-dehydratase [Aromatoleum sp.]MDT3671432.1 GDP-mannose 4,6-dehydratase [Aromatoleum sp.]